MLQVIIAIGKINNQEKDRGRKFRHGEGLECIRWESIFKQRLKKY